MSQPFIDALAPEVGVGDTVQTEDGEIGVVMSADWGPVFGLLTLNTRRVIPVSPNSRVWTRKRYAA